MIMRYHKIALTAGIALAMAFTFGCSGDSDSGDNNPGVTPSSDSSAGISSSGGGGSSSSGGSSSGGNSSSSSEYTGGSCNASDYGPVNINGQIWMAKNWGCYAPGSKCYNNDPANCAKYGRLYDWATAMALPSKCNRTLSTRDADCTIRTPNHQGICPSGWHIPSDEDWDRLYRYADGTDGTSSRYDSPTAGRYLKAGDGWNSGGNGEDTSGFSALPGGSGDSGGIFSDVGYYGNWWSASEHHSLNAYYRYMYYNFEDANWLSIGKYNLFSVRCLQD